MSDEQQTFYYLSVALAVGLLIGVERGWKERAMAEGTRVAGLRTSGVPYAALPRLDFSADVLARASAVTMLGWSDALGWSDLRSDD